MVALLAAAVLAWLALTDEKPAPGTTIALAEVAIAPRAAPVEAPPAEAQPAEAQPAEAQPSKAKSSEATASHAAPSEARAPEAQPSHSAGRTQPPAPPKPEPPKIASPAPAAPNAAAAAAPPATTPALLPAQQATLPPSPRTGPDPALLEASADGALPRIGADGRMPWQVYARPFDRADKRPRIAIVIANLGLGEAQTEAAIQRLPGAITLAFSPYAGNKLAQWAELARVAGHEVLLGVPMEPANYPDSDPGPHTLLTTLPPAQNLERLNWVLARFPGYVGVTNQMGQRFTASAEPLRPMLAELRGRGLLFLDARTAAKTAVALVAGEIDLARATSDRTIDAQPSRDAINARLAELEQLARKRGHAVAIGHPFPVTIELVKAWARTLHDRGIALAPISAVAVTGPEK